MAWDGAVGFGARVGPAGRGRILSKRLKSFPNVETLGYGPGGQKAGALKYPRHGDKGIP